MDTNDDDVEINEEDMDFFREHAIPTYTLNSFDDGKPPYEEESRNFPSDTEETSALPIKLNGQWQLPSMLEESTPIDCRRDPAVNRREKKEREVRLKEREVRLKERDQERTNKHNLASSTDNAEEPCRPTKEKALDVNADDALEQIALSAMSIVQNPERHV